VKVTEILSMFSSKTFLVLAFTFMFIRLGSSNGKAFA
jgi:hypothetical protein